ncbi:MAG TPA: PDZ domain-containing protein [Candidatus Gemmiger stercoravium]|uniref:S41 family peptidase n=1 Tax=uncultured Subdoligranulum sp. TaxID=512298 RepID=UPI001F912C2A|nr:S41 family peptidase [uncultured Subdoligranulum sp.]HJC55088.1 PDZ domain-containing protein [Candidatus Gemmiger stercoravium]
MSKKVNLAVAATVTLIAMAVTFSITMVVSMDMFNNIVSGVKNREQMYNKLAEIDRYVRNNEYAEINEDTLNDTIASGYMLGINDPYARYYSAKAYSERMGLENGRLMNVGVSVIKDSSSGYARILRVYDGSPAAENGLEAGGFITAINGTGVRTMTDTAAINSALIGEEGTTVSISYLTPDRQEQTMDLVHANYTTTTVFAQLLDGNVAYIDIDAFSANTGLEFRSAVDSMLNQGAVAFVFDLRDNTGETLNSALIAADYCVPAGLVAQSQAKDGTVTDLRVSDDHEVTLPMACLVNESTAGGAELFANALRKMSGANLVGTTTAGMGVLLSDPQSFSDGSAAVITVGLLLDNEGETWNGAGLTPDVDAALTADEQSSYYDFTVQTDPQISRAVNAVLALVG